MKKLLTTITSILLFSCLSASAAPAQQKSTSEWAGKWFQVEMIVFSHLTKQGITSEHWDLLSRPNFNNLELLQFDSPGIEQLTPQAFTMNKEQRILSNQPNYQVLLHTAWKQQVYEPRDAQALQIANNEQGLDGTVTVSVRRYLRVNFNLYFAMPADQLSAVVGNEYSNATQDGFAYFHLVQSRRMRSNEINYIGHPLYGVLIKITRSSADNDPQLQTQQQSTAQAPAPVQLQAPQQTT